MQYVERKQYNKVISVKLVIPSGCNAKCEFCYLNDKRVQRKYDKQHFLENFIDSIKLIIEKVDGKNPISLDITGNEPTYDVELLKEVLLKLKEFNIKDKVLRTTITTNGCNLDELIPYFDKVIDYANISIHDFRKQYRDRIFGCDTLSDIDYKNIVSELSKIGIKSSAVSVIYKPIKNFDEWRDLFIEWCRKQGFIALRLRHNVFNTDNSVFEGYMQSALNCKDFTVITHEKTVDSHWCRLRRYDGFRLFFLSGILETYIYTKGIEYCVDDDGLLYADFYKQIPIDKYEFEVGKIFDLVD